MVSRRGSAEAFEDALESFDASQTSPGFTADYSSFVFTGKLPLRGGRHNQSGTASSIASLKSKAVEFPKEEAAAQAHEASGCSNSAGVSTGSSSRVGRDSTAREVLRGSLVRSPAPRLKAESGTARQPHYQAQKQQQKLPMKQGAEGLPVIDSRKVEESRRSARAASECQRGSVASPHCTYHSVSSSSEGKSARCPSSVAASQGLSGVEKPRRAIGRYSSVPAFSAADRLRIDRFKVRPARQTGFFARLPACSKDAAIWRHEAVFLRARVLFCRASTGRFAAVLEHTRSNFEAAGSGREENLVRTVRGIVYCSI